jgi:cyclic pyranopterin phosphate synthase
MIKNLRISITTKCKQACWYCFNEGQNFTQINLEDMDGLRWLLGCLSREFGTEIVRLTGGEPLEHPTPLEFAKIAKQAGISKVGLTTNGRDFAKYSPLFEDFGIDDCAVHLWQLNSGTKINMSRIFDTMSDFKRFYAKTRFNIVLTRSNAPYVHEVVCYAIKNGINLLILDLLQAGVLESDFKNEHYPLSTLHSALYEHKLIETKDNVNVRVFTGSNMSIKLVDHYKDGMKPSSYCTKNLTLNPILLTPDFRLSYCTHFSKPKHSLLEVVRDKNLEQLRTVLMAVKQDLKNCSKCTKKYILSDDWQLDN